MKAIKIYKHIISNNYANIKTKIKNMRKQMHKGDKVAQCKSCWTVEAQGRRSLRLNLNDFITNGRGSHLESSWLQSYFNRKDDFVTDQVMLTDIKIGNTCNFACVMCNPKDSSMIYNYWSKNKSFLKILTN